MENHIKSFFILAALAGIVFVVGWSIFLIIFGISILLSISYILFWPINFDPIVSSKNKIIPLVGVLSPNNKLAQVEKIGNLTAIGPEDIAFDQKGWLYAGVENGDILKMQPDGSQMTVFAKVKGRPLGINFDTKGNLLVASVGEGFLSIDKSGSTSILIDNLKGSRLEFEECAIQAPDGMIYLTEGYSTPKEMNPFDAVIYEYLERKFSGRLLEFNPKTKVAQILKTNIKLPNGMVLSPDSSYLLINQTFEANIIRYWLKGPQKGEFEIFASLPGYPDNISVGTKGIYWVALITPLNEVMENLSDKPFIRKMIARLPKALLPSANNGGSSILGLNDKGEIIYNFSDADLKQHNFTSAVEHNGYLYLGNWNASNTISRLKLQ